MSKPKPTTCVEWLQLREPADGDIERNLVEGFAAGREAFRTQALKALNRVLRRSGASYDDDRIADGIVEAAKAIEELV